MELDKSEQSGTHYTLINQVNKRHEKKTPFLVKINDSCRDHPYCFVNIPPISLEKNDYPSPNILQLLQHVFYCEAE
jgi:hypothetical protein